MEEKYIPSIVKSIAKRIDSIRINQNFSIRELAHKSGISPSTLFDIIVGNKIPNIYTLYCICSALSISLTDFFNFDDKVLRLREKEALLIKIFREISPMSQDTLIKLTKCMK